MKEFRVVLEFRMRLVCRGMAPKRPVEVPKKSAAPVEAGS